MDTNQFIISVTVNNEPGVLIRVASLFSRRGYNIISLTVAETENKSRSRIIIVSNGDEQVKQQIIRQLAKLNIVDCVECLDEKDIVARELLLVRLKADNAARNQIMDIANVYRSKIVHLSKSTIILEISSDTEKLNALMDILHTFDIEEISRTGLTAISRK